MDETERLAFEPYGEPLPERLPDGSPSGDPASPVETAFSRDDHSGASERDPGGGVQTSPELAEAEQPDTADVRDDTVPSAWGATAEWSVWGESSCPPTATPVPDAVPAPETGASQAAPQTCEPQDSPATEAPTEAPEPSVLAPARPALPEEPAGDSPAASGEIVEASPAVPSDPPDILHEHAIAAAAPGPATTEPGEDAQIPVPARDALVERMEAAAAAHFMAEQPFRPSDQEPTLDLVDPAVAPEPDTVAEPAVAAPSPVEAQDEREEQIAVEPPQPAPTQPASEAPESVGAPIAAATVRLDQPAAAEHVASVPEAHDVAPPLAMPHRSYSQRLRRLARAAGYAAAGYLALVLALIVVYRFVNPPLSTLMVYEGLFGSGARRTWVPLDQISPHLVRAVLVSEDGRFCDHFGIDFAAIEDAIENAKGGIPRGASTISMQVTKNLFLWQSKSYVRKIVELPLTLVMELLWPKARILEVYLNIAEWGPGVFGAEEAARHHFSRPAASLGEREAALLAAALPNPIRRDAGDPGPRTVRKASVIQSRMRSAGAVDACIPGRRGGG